MRKIVIVLLLSIPELLAAQGKPLYTAKFGIAPYSFRRSFPNGVAATLDTIAAMGFTEIEGGGGKGITDQDYKKLCDERGLSIPSFGAGYDEVVNNTQAIIERAKIFGSKYVMISWIQHDRGKFNIDNARKAVEDFNAAGKVLHEHGITLCYHAHGYEFQPYEKGTLLDYIITNTDPAYVSFEMDVMWIYFGGGDPAKLLKKYGNRWKLMHLKDLKKGTARDLTGLTSPENDVTLGTGELDIPGILKEARKVGIAHYFIEDESSRIITQIPESIAYLKRLKQ